MSARVIVLSSPLVHERATGLVRSLASLRVSAEVALDIPRAQLDACELVVALADGAARRSPAWNQALGYALGLGRGVVLVSRRPLDGVAAGLDRLPWPRHFERLAPRIRALLPATARAASRSLALTSDPRWQAAIVAEARAELARRGWREAPMSARAFVEPSLEPVWRLGRTTMRLRVAPFNPVDLLRVRTAAAPRVFEWWVLRDSRPDRWMRRVFGGAAEKLTARTKYFGRDVAVGERDPLVARRFLTQRVDRTGALADELAAVEAWLARRALTKGLAEPAHAGAVGPPR